MELCIRKKKKDRRSLFLMDYLRYEAFLPVHFQQPCHTQSSLLLYKSEYHQENSIDKQILQPNAEAMLLL